MRLLLLFQLQALHARFSFTFAPAQLCPSQAVHNISMSAWGGSVIEVPEDPTWRFHMYNGIYTQRCGVNYWRGNSAVAHLVSTTPEGPFLYLDEALPLWHTNPQVVRDPVDGTFVLFAIGQSVNHSAWVECNCSASPACPPGPSPNPNLAGVIDAHTSKTPYGPWTPLIINGSTVVMHGGTNPAPLFLPNGTLLLGVNAEGTKVAIVPNWRVGPYNARQGTLPSIPMNWYEDPFLFEYGGKFRQLVHQYNGSNPGAQFATGGYGETAGDSSVFAPWVYGGLADPAYTNNVSYVDGSIQTLRRRERPKLLFTLDGRLFLYTAAQSPLNASRDFSFTLVQEVLSMPV